MDPHEDHRSGGGALQNSYFSPIASQIEANNTAMDVDQPDNSVETLRALLANSRSALTRAVEEAQDLEAISDEDDANNPEFGQTRGEELDHEALAKMTSRDREAAIKRARNREAARRSRQRKNERINHLYRNIKSLQSENLLLLKCIEEFTQKAIACKEEQIDMKEQLARLAAPPPTGDDLPFTCVAPMEEEEEDVHVAASISSLPGRRPSPVSGLNLPSLQEELQRLQRMHPTDASGPLTARGGGALSARGSAALAEHIAMLSKENSPRDEEDVVAGGGAQAVVVGVGGAGVTPMAVTIGAVVGPQQQHQQQQQQQQHQQQQDEKLISGAGIPPPNISQFFPSSAHQPSTLVDLQTLFGSNQNNTNTNDNSTRKK